MGGDRNCLDGIFLGKFLEGGKEPVFHSLQVMHIQFITCYWMRYLHRLKILVGSVQLSEILVIYSNLFVCHTDVDDGYGIVHKIFLLKYCQ